MGMMVMTHGSKLSLLDLTEVNILSISMRDGYKHSLTKIGGFLRQYSLVTIVVFNFFILQFYSSMGDRIHKINVRVCSKQFQKE